MSALPLRDICIALGLQPEDGQLEALERYQQLLQQWNRTYNLTALRDPSHIRIRHLADCLAVIEPVRRLGLQSGRVLDVGSGGGLPGVVLAILLPGLQVSCVDAVGKKVAFVRQVAASLNLPNLRAMHSRVEGLRLPAFDWITSRAFSDLPNFCRLTQHLLEPNGVWMAMKGKHPADELAALEMEPGARSRVFHVEQLDVPGLPGERCLVWMRKTHTP